MAGTVVYHVSSCPYHPHASFYQRLIFDTSFFCAGDFFFSPLSRGFPSSVFSLFCLVPHWDGPFRVKERKHNFFISKAPFSFRKYHSTISKMDLHGSAPFLDHFGTPFWHCFRTPFWIPFWAPFAPPLGQFLHPCLEAFWPPSGTPVVPFSWIPFGSFLEQLFEPFLDLAWTLPQDFN